MEVMFRAIDSIDGGNPTVRIQNNLRETDIAALSIVLARNRTLHHLTLIWLDDNFIDPYGWRYLAEALGRNSTLTTLHIFRAHMNDDGVRAFIGFSSRNDTIRSLSLRSCSMGHIGANFISEELRLARSSIINLSLGFNLIGDIGARAVAMITTLRELDLEANHIGPNGAHALAENTSIHTLRLGRNNIGTEGVRALASNATLLHLYLEDSNIDAEGARALAENATLWSLHLCYNNIGTEGAIYLANNATLTELEVGTNGIGYEGARALVRNATLINLNLENNDVGSGGGRGGRALATDLANNATLMRLNLSGTSIDDQGAIALATTLENNNTLKELRLDVNNIGSVGGRALATALDKNRSLLYRPIIEFINRTLLDSDTISKINDRIRLNYILDRNFRNWIEQQLEIITRIPRNINIEFVIQSVFYANAGELMGNDWDSVEGKRFAAEYLLKQFDRSVPRQ